MKKKLILAITSVLFLIIIFIIGLWHPQIHLSSTTISEIKTDEKILVLSFDDGPGEETEAILDILREKNVPATFFLVGERIAWYENTTKRILTEGHNIGNHGYTHKHAMFGGVKEYALGKKILEETTNNNIIYYRPPYGFRSIGIVKKTQEDQTKIVLWDNMPMDFLRWDAERISTHVINRIHPGSIIVLHDGPEGRERTRDALTLIIDGARAQGYRFVSITDALEIETQNT